MSEPTEPSAPPAAEDVRLDESAYDVIEIDEAPPEPSPEPSPAARAAAEMQRGIARLAYHAKLLQLVQATQQWCQVVADVSRAAQAIDPDGSAVPEASENAAIDTMRVLLASAAATSPGLAELFAAASGNVRVAVPV